jgi:AcrR family transcriptional regulator
MSSMIPNNSSPVQPDASVPAARKPREDGVRSRQAILLAAANLATTRGLEGLSLGQLAEHIGMSKSGLYAHFKSKEELELATIETAAEIFEREVLVPAGKSPAGLGRVWSLAEAFLAHLERRVFPGGCFFAATAAQLAAQPGRARDRVMAMHQHWQKLFIDALRQAVDEGALPRTIDLEQTVFEITAMLLRANFTWIATGDAEALDQARAGIRHVLKRVAGTGTHKGRPTNRREGSRSSRRHA